MFHSSSIYLHNLKNEDLNKIQDELIIFSQKQQIFETANSCLFFIKELEAISTEFSEKLAKLRDEITGNITANKIKDYINFFVENYNISITNQMIT